MFITANAGDMLVEIFILKIYMTSFYIHGDLHVNMVVAKWHKNGVTLSYVVWFKQR